MTISDLLTVREVASLIRVSKPTLDRWRTEGRGPRYVRVGTRVLYPKTEVERFLAENLVETAPFRPRASAKRREDGR